MERREYFLDRLKRNLLMNLKFISFLAKTNTDEWISSSSFLRESENLVWNVDST